MMILGFAGIGFVACTTRQSVGLVLRLHTMNRLLIGSADKTNLLLQLLQNETSVTVIDPTGEQAKAAANQLPPSLTQRALYFDPADMARPVGLNYIGLIAPIVEAVQQLSAEVQNLTATVAGFAQSFTSKQITASQQLCVDKSDGTAVCINGDQLIQGNNPSIIHVGDTYTDLGALVHDNQGHNLSYRTFINGVLSGNILIDTSQAATDTIDYVATDTWGNTATSTRTIIIEESPSIVPTNEASTASSSPSVQ